MNTDLIAGYVLLYILTIAAAVILPTAIIGWWRDQRARREAQRALMLRLSRLRSECIVCGWPLNNHDRFKHSAAGIPIPEENRS